MLVFFVARIVSPCHNRLVFDQDVQEEECCISSCQPLTFPEVISKKDRKGRKEGSVITDSKAIVCEAIRQLNSCVNLPYLTTDFNEKCLKIFVIQDFYCVCIWRGNHTSVICYY